MKASPSLSAWLAGLSRRERIFVLAGAAVVALALAMTLLVLPALDRWSTREAALAASRERHARLQALVASEEGLRRALGERRRAQAGAMRLLLAGATPALAASNLQALLQQYAEESLVQLNRVDVAGQPRADGPGLLSVPVLLQGQGDVHGLVDFLYRVQHGQRLLVIDEIAVNTRSSYLGDEDQSLIWSLRARGLYPSSEATR
ncbi:MAG TPA: type II secretion system protein GspM [Gemmatimonadales bacterium]